MIEPCPQERAKAEINPHDRSPAILSFDCVLAEACEQTEASIFEALLSLLERLADMNGHHIVSDPTNVENRKLAAVRDYIRCRCVFRRS